MIDKQMSIIFVFVKLHLLFGSKEFVIIERQTGTAVFSIPEHRFLSVIFPTYKIVNNPK